MHIRKNIARRRFLQGIGGSFLGLWKMRGFLTF